MLKIYAIHDIVKKLKEDMLMHCLFYGLTGFDSVSSFNGIGKKMAWQIWKIMLEITEVFKRCWKEDSMEVNPKIERFIILLYCKISGVTDIHQA